MKNKYYIGLLSGTSIDGIDAAVVDFSASKPRVICTHREEIPPTLSDKLHALCQPLADGIDHVSQVDTELASIFSQAAQQLLSKSGLQKSDITAIGSHGQTVRHSPNTQPRYSVQLADPNIIAQQTGITTVADFRRRDIANGGQGAPLTPAFHQFLFTDENKKIIVLNIGGFANITYLDGKNNISGFDTGPGNTLSDAWCRRHYDCQYDNKGQHARRGNVIPVLLSALLQEPYFQLEPPKSTGRELFNLAWLDTHLEKLPSEPQHDDVTATLIEFTTLTIVNAIKRFAPEHDRIILCGGGVHNDYLIERLSHHLNESQLSTSEDFGIHPDWLEAAAFAWLAQQTIEKNPVDLTMVTGAASPTILGGVYW